MSIIKENTVRKTFNINKDIAKKMEKYLPQRKQTEFVNHALDREFEKLENERKRSENVSILKSIKPIKGCGKNILDYLKQDRGQRIDDITNKNS